MQRSGQRFSFKDLINVTFEDGSVHLKHLKVLFEILVTHMKLDDVQITFENQIYQTRIDPTLQELITSNFCKSDTNPIVEMLDLLNVTKRVEAVEISFGKMVSMVDSVLNHQTRLDENYTNLKQLIDEFSEERAASTLFEIDEMSKRNEVSKILEGSTEELLEPNKDACNKKPTIHVTREEIDGIMQQHVDSTVQRFEKLISGSKQDICELQRKTNDMQEQIEDLMFACEQNDIKTDETANEIKEFTSKIFCIKTDVKTLMNESVEFKDMFVALNVKCDTLEKDKTNKFYVDELWRQKAFKSDLELFIRRNEFDPVSDVIRLKLALLEDNCKNLLMNLKKSLARFKSELDEKLDKHELHKLKNITSKSFEAFLVELKVLLCEVMKSPIGIGGTKLTTRDLNCISCTSKIAMTKSATNLPKLDMMSYRFKKELDKSFPNTAKSSTNAEFRRIFGPQVKPAVQNQMLSQNDSRLNFPNSQPCFIISEDNSIWKADPLTTLNNPKYLPS